MATVDYVESNPWAELQTCFISEIFDGVNRGQARMKEVFTTQLMQNNLLHEVEETTKGPEWWKKTIAAFFYNLHEWVRHVHKMPSDIC